MQDGRLVELVDFDAELLDQGFLRPFDESEDGVYEEREFPAVEFVLGLSERLVVFVLVLRDRPGEGQHGGQSEIVAEVEREQIPACPAVAVVERVDVFEQEVAGYRPLQERYGIRPGEVHHLCEQR